MSNVRTSNNYGEVEGANALLISQYLLRSSLIVILSDVEFREEGGARHLTIKANVEFSR
jgi:hypothetical protein